MSILINSQNSWRDDLGSDMDKAKALLADTEISGTFIANTTGINQMNISNYRTGKTDVKKAKWEIIAKLSRAYEADWIQKQIGNRQTEFAQFIKNFTGKITKYANQVEKEDIAMGDTIDLLNDMTTSDIIQSIELYKNYIDED
ncbi:hypothetical protein [Loigolactobacillus backii]|uniref:hypothetical protein n=1 Tax=Loigolactobacillus backii TaxID=375175 RepID=UPI0007F1781C|nr:hypothetical protein [Loigolactobacillus backii]ANK66610.1 hypothetical protein AYR55_02205 [Loigolactobacillus backii]OLF70829.1 hypothetical protein ACX53_00475 [Loigolactobacillus backii]PIO87323.1 hypothetical protein B8A32_09360 [Loigolactobacillus backii]